MKFRVQRKLTLTVFIWITLLMIIENPMFQPLNLVVQSSQLTATNPNINSGLSFQGSCLVNTVIKNVQATNTTDNQLVNAYQVSVTIFNFMSLMLLILPFVIFIYSERIRTVKVIPKTIRKRKEVK
jgi:hypothetical protein